MSDAVTSTQWGLPPSLESELSAIATEMGCELAHADYSGNRLRMVLDHPDGVTLEHCERFSRQASAALDVEDFGPEKYVLEVSSPGLDRRLYRRRDYERFLGDRVRVRFEDDTSHAKRTVVGTLAAVDDRDGGRIRLVERQGGATHTIALERVETARLEIEL